MIIEKFRLLKSDIERDLYLKALAERTGLDEALLRRKMSRSAASRPAQEPARPAPAQPARPQLSGSVVKAQQAILRLVIEEESICREVLDGELKDYFPDERFRVIAEQARAYFNETGHVDAEALQARLEGESQAILSGILIGELAALGDEPERLFADCC
ncbi:MAG: hypothetical protein GWN87_10205, partial [Desulfuromonadales bacterium]|nr:hypothetical protein [Desulfuromonadales bacterium]NIS43366.1 hypothetical protein [Desulfuromonadales bacterium]